MQKISHICPIAFLICAANVLPMAGETLAWPPNLPVYDHIVIVVEENKDFEEIFGGKFDAPYLKKLATEGASIGHMFGEEHPSEGNYFWLFSGSNQNVGFADVVPSGANRPDYPLKASSLGEQLIQKGHSFKGYAEDLPSPDPTIDFVPKDCNGGPSCVYGRKHVPWISFAKVPTSSNLQFKDDFPSDYTQLPTVAFVIPNLNHDMHNGDPAHSIPAGDNWLQQNLDGYYQWAKKNNSLPIVTFDENDDQGGDRGPTDPKVDPGPTYPPVGANNQHLLDLQNRIVTIFAGAHIKPGLKQDAYSEGKGITHVNILRTIEAMYGLPKSGAQQPNATGAGIGDETIVTDIFESVK